MIGLWPGSMCEYAFFGEVNPRSNDSDGDKPRPYEKNRCHKAD
jgi:hypothetical protein